MPYISLALYSEGRSDQPFLQKIILRAVQDAAATHFLRNFEVQEAFVRGDRYGRGNNRGQRISDQFAELMRNGAVSILFIHADGDGDADAARSERIDPARVILAANIGDGIDGRIVAVVPVRETEAWALADREALTNEFGLSRQTVERQLGPMAVERIMDPKSVLRDLLDSRTRRRKRDAMTALSGSLGDRISLVALRNLPSFNALEAELAGAIRRLWPER